MSDIAVIVATTLRDKTLNDLLAENKKLRSELEAVKREKENEKSHHQLTITLLELEMDGEISALEGERNKLKWEKEVEKRDLEFKIEMIKQETQIEKRALEFEIEKVKREKVIEKRDYAWKIGTVKRDLVYHTTGGASG